MKTTKYIVYSLGLCGLLSWILACQDSQPKNASDPNATATTSSTTGTTTGFTPEQPAPQKLSWTGKLNISNVKKYHALLRGQSRCNVCSKSGGNASCNRFGQILDMKVTFDRKELPATVTVTLIPVRGQTWYTVQFFCDPTHPNPTAPLVYRGTAKYINDYGGFRVRFHRSADIFGQAGLSYLILRSEYGLPEDDSLDVTVYYGGSSNDNNEMGTADLAIPGTEPNYLSR